MFDKNQTIASFDPEIWASIQNEGQRQEDHIELIASENYTSPMVIAAQGTKLTNKYNIIFDKRINNFIIF